MKRRDDADQPDEEDRTSESPAAAPLQHDTWPAARQRSTNRTEPFETTAYSPPTLPHSSLRVAPDSDSLARTNSDASRLAAGDRFDDFQVIAELGRGAFGVVYLARQLSLDREVALKVSPNEGSEGRQMARLEHPHIVQVFAEKATADGAMRLLCMQYVPGTSLHSALKILREKHRFPWSGRDLIETIDDASRLPAPLDPIALRDRHFLSNCDLVEACCWLIARLAEGLGFAHHHGVLHRDIKPGNILQSQYGRPLLADFNLALQSDDCEAQEQTFGGTLLYMAPEHCEALNPHNPTPHDVVDQASDIYSLGVVLYEMLTGRPPFSIGQPPYDLDAMAEARRLGPEFPELPHLEKHQSLIRIVKKCMASSPNDRFESAVELSTVLDGFRRDRAIVAALPGGGPVTRAALRAPVLWLVVLAALPHLCASIVNVVYNGVRIAGELTNQQQQAFANLVLVYNIVVWPVCLLWMLLSSRAVVRYLRNPSLFESEKPASLNRARQKLLRLPKNMFIVTCIAWLSGCIFFPLGLHWMAGPISSTVAIHFTIDLLLSWLIALTYSVLAVQYITLRVVYPSMWPDPGCDPEVASGELVAVSRRSRSLHILAGVIPLAGAVLMIAVGPQAFTSAEYGVFRMLVTALIIIGMAGFQMAASVTNLISRTISALTEGKLV